ncbi:MAG: hypothetical protein Q8P95_05280 [bacterium]|nr:hypothetical protein [bacterium]
MKERQQQILLAIIDNFIRTAIPVGSKTVVRHYQLRVSGATVRNEMQMLEEQGLICSPHTSAGRIPTTKGYRMFVESSKKEAEKEEKAAKSTFLQTLEGYQAVQDRQQVYRAVDILARVVDNIAFATVPDNDRTIFLGLSNTLRQPEFMANPEVASRVVEVLEHDFVSLLGTIDIDEEVRVYIGEENLIQQFQSCSMLVTKYRLGKSSGVMGVLGPMRMRYAYNRAALEQARDFLESEE